MLVVDFKFLLVSVLCIEYLHADGKTIEIADGKIKGVLRTTINNVRFYSFQGIPYAQPPIKKLRFKAPLPIEPWGEVLDATRERNICYRVKSNNNRESEDCLFINVFTPAEPSPKSALPVIFYIYGGGFIGGSSDESSYGPNHLMEYGIVLVTFNYRVGPFGFFSTGDDAIPGNAGLKDQNLALKWVQKNIANFGGDPKKVTIFGQSAGGASVGYQILSPLSAGLFRGAIAGSGSPLSAWAYQRDQVEITYQTAGYINKKMANVSSSELLEYLLGLPAKDIDAASYTMWSTENIDNRQIQQGFFYTPVIEHEHEGAFLTVSMFELLRRGDFNRVPLLTGFCSEESIFYITAHPDIEKLLSTSFDKNNELLIPRGMQVTSANNRVLAAKEIKEFYVGNGSFTKNPSQLTKYFTDQSFARSLIKHATLQSAFTDVYFYRFAYSGVIGGFVKKSAQGFSDNLRHGEELSYIFRRNQKTLNNTDLTKYPEQDQIVFKRFITLFTNFAKTLNPTPKQHELLENIIWPKVNATDFAYLDIGSSSQIKYHPREPNYHKWETIFYKYGVPPYYSY